MDPATLRRQPASRAGELEPTGPVCAETARRLACDAGVSRVVTADDSDSLANLVLLCRRHHRIVHETGYRLETRGPDGGPVRPPGWRAGRAPPWLV